ncbi:hypothetical protein GCM10010967_57910 [Dyadobacter beijingensis]|uniref:Uncharacterized protein n=1 Tax=Dyadobacter beijingensis TaxID=365489 RepID=A0ABQ2IJL3_9BACT|nr:hypothetical protein [Dyadobacter beijingensis]GGN14109.1 hypothetical protein GCM10010967_57910 [Dyadobacter beijingensis]
MSQNDIIRKAVKNAGIADPNPEWGKERIEAIEDTNGKTYKVKLVCRPWNKEDARRYDTWSFVEIIE